MPGQECTLISLVKEGIVWKALPWSAWPRSAGICADSTHSPAKRKNRNSQNYLFLV